MQHMVARGESIEDAVLVLADTRMSLAEAPWLGTLWDAGTSRMLPRASRLHYNLFLSMAGQEVDNPVYDLLDAYRKALNDVDADLP